MPSSQLCSPSHTHKHNHTRLCGKTRKQNQFLRKRRGNTSIQPKAMLEEFSRAVEEASAWCERTVESMRFENWAPRSSRAWRLREYKSESDASQYRSGIDTKNGNYAESVADIALDDVMRMRREMSEAGELNLSTLGLECADYAEGETCSLDDMGDGLEAEFNATIDDRYKQELLKAPPLSGQELADLCYKKYGKFHDMCVKNSCISKGNTRRWVALNVYIGHLGQKSFPMTSAEYVQKLESVAQICTGLRQSAYIREFFAEPPIPRRGLPSRPRTDTAVSLRLNRSPTWSDDVAEEFFST